MSNGNPPDFDDYDDASRYCRDLGIIATDRPIRFANPIYREIIVRILNAQFTDGFDNDLVQTPWYLRPDGSLDMDKLLTEFQKFYRENAESWLDRFHYKEAGQQLLLMAFLQRIINGGGRIEREMAAGNGRTDLAIYWKNEVFVLELKIKRKPTTLENGIVQLSRYLDTLGQKHGYLVLFEPKKSDEIPWENRLRREEIEHEGRRITLLEM